MFQRSGAQRRVAVTRDMVFPAPARGWVQSGNITTAGKDQAEVLDNFFPTAQGARLRGGATSYADIGAAVTRLFTFSGSAADDLIAGTATAVFDVDRVASGSNTFGDMEGMTSGDWSTTQISTSGGEFMVAVNGSDYAFFWDGTDFEPLAGVATNNLGFDAETADFAVDETVTGGTSGATATILGITKTSATAGTLKVGTITGTFQDNEALTSTSGAATSDIPSGTSAASAITITNVATNVLSQVWLFKERLFFVQKDTTKVWYLPVKSIGGAAVSLNLGSVFRRGGNVLFGATWSLDSGSGLDDMCVFVSTNGEVAVYEGTDPAAASTFALVGVYDIAQPLNKHGHFKAGGDVAILTKDGIIGISQVLGKDRGALQATAITYPIEDEWSKAILDATAAYPVTATLWQSETLLLVGTPQKVGGVNVSLAANARTGAWSRVLGWDVRCSAVASDILYFADVNGVVQKADTGGSDNGVQYTAKYVPKFSDEGAPQVKVANHAGLTYRALRALEFKMVAMSDYQVDAVTPPANATTVAVDKWGTGVWGTFVWTDRTASSVFSKWKGVGAQGYSLAPCVLITSNQSEAIAFEILATRLRYEIASVL